MRMDVVVGSCCDVVQVDSAAVGIWLTGLGESGRSTVARAPPIGGVVYGGGVVQDSEAHSETSVKRVRESRRWRAIAVVQAACTTAPIRERMSWRRQLTSAATDAAAASSSATRKQSQCRSTDPRAETYPCTSQP